MTESVIGVDPGISGAVALRSPQGIDVFDMPTHDLKGRTRIDIHALDHKLNTLVLLHEPGLAVIEDVHSMPKQGVASSFAFGFAAGVIQSLLVARGVPIRLVSPGAWKRVLGLGRDKDESRLRASRLYPRHAHLWARKKDDGRAEAVLLAHYGTLK